MEPNKPDHPERSRESGDDVPRTTGHDPTLVDATLEAGSFALTPSGLPVETPGPRPAQVGRYPILRELGRGGMGVVYLAEDPTLGRVVALKRLPDSMAHDHGRMERFRQEARILASLNHPNIATIHSLEEADGVCFLTMEAIERETLAARLASGPMELEEALKVGRQIARALESAHSRGIVHRDLKPGNIMFTSDLDVKVLDFGLAASATREHASPEAADPEQPHIDALSGTPGYMSPEQIENAPSDPRMDVWSFGCVLFECLTGLRAIEGSSAIERIRTTATTGPDIGRLHDSCPAQLRTVIEKCLARDPEQRFPSITEPRQAIEEMLAELAFPSGRATEREPSEAIANNLPRHASSFIGRAEQLAEVTRLLSAHRLVTLTGIGGAGKTRLALAAAESLLGDPYEGVWFVELAPLANAESIPAVVMNSIGIRESLDRPALQAIADHLRAKRVLLVLDNCEHVIDGVARVVGALLRDLPELRVIVTSRERLAIDGEACYAVPLLRLPETASLDLDAIARCEAVDLFLQRARQAGASLTLTPVNAEAIVEVCRRLDGIPLAIELAAARAKVLSVDEIRRRMDDRFRLLTGGARDDLPHHRTLRALIDWSYEQLDPAEQTLLQRLSVFAKSWSLEAAESVASGDPVHDWDILDLMARLVDKSLVVADTAERETTEGSTRFRMLETVRAYAASLLEGGSEGPEIRRRHRDYFISLAERAEPEFTGQQQAFWYAKVAAEHDEIRRAFETCREPGADPSLALRMAGALFRYWHVRGHWSEGEATSRDAIGRAADLPATAEKAKTLNVIAVFALFKGRLDEARSGLEETLAVWTELGKAPGIASARLNLGNVAYMAGDYDAAKREYAASLEIMRGLDQADGVCRSLISLANIALVQRDYEQSREYAREAVERTQRIGHAELRAHALVTMGTAEMRLERFGEAERHYEASLAIQKELGDRRNIAIALVNLAVTQHRQGRGIESHRNYCEAARMFLALGDVGSAASALEGLASLAYEQGNYRHTVKVHGATNALREKAGLPRMPDEETNSLGLLAGSRERLDDAEMARLLEEGRAMTLGEAVEWAVREIRPV